MFHVVIDSSRCEGHAKCVLDCPEVFDCDDDGFGIVKTDEVQEDLRNAVMRAVAGCPEFAISVTD